MITEHEIENWFTYHPPSTSQAVRYSQVNDMCKQFARLVLEVTQPSADQTAALRTLRRLRMDVNLTIACESEPKTPVIRFDTP